MRVKYIDFEKIMLKNMYVFSDILGKHFNFIYSNNPELVFYTTSNKNEFNCKKVFYTGENITPPMDCDLSFSFCDNTKTNFQLPNFARFESFFDFKETKNPIYENSGENFCNFMYYNNMPKDRIIFCEKIKEYKPIDCPGKVLNNMTCALPRHSPDWINDKLNFLKDYKFTIAFENESSSNYITEKIFHAFLAGSVPIYWGAENVGCFFNSKCFINVNDFDSFDNAIEYIKKVDNDDELYSSYFDDFPIHKKSKLNNITEENIITFFERNITHEQ